MCGQIKWGRGEACVEDADWASSDKPVLLTSDGCVHVSDCNLQISNNVEMSSRELEGEGYSKREVDHVSSRVLQM